MGYLITTCNNKLAIQNLSYPQYFINYSHRVLNDDNQQIKKYSTINNILKLSLQKHTPHHSYLTTQISPEMTTNSHTLKNLKFSRLLIFFQRLITILKLYFYIQTINFQYTLFQAPMMFLFQSTVVTVLYQQVPTKLRMAPTSIILQKYNRQTIQFFDFLYKGKLGDAYGISLKQILKTQLLNLQAIITPIRI
eukprot:TRINITY_DN1449_c1_g1_i3.p1 TRINITY_DN1449_c1_g1~~TRINITY_DN1449_c1_g1_i3.p1  ORF type:complete len:193 (+),score=-25.35 TRINITY_DN1449_c1_g1_i3:526-1104(+)